MLDFFNPEYDFQESLKLSKNKKFPENLKKEMLASFTKKEAAAVFFNEPLLRYQNKCEKFFY